MQRQSKVISLQDFLPVREKLKKEGKLVVFTNGCFDLIHRGHVEYLAVARSLGDVLVVGLNTDDSVRRLKGEKRPLVDQESRAVVLSALESVSYIILFDEDTPLELIREIQPDILVKGSDYAIDQIVGADEVIRNRGRVETVALTEGFSTTDLIKRIMERYC